ncbi:MAG: orotidine-5'-phosphate decarboxylase [Deltaproteobacteria bacterium]
MSRQTPPASPRERLIFPLDVDSSSEALKFVDLLRDEVGVFKVGKQLFLHSGPEIIREIRKRGGEVFLDLKFHDIPRTVARASREATRLAVKMFTLHASGSTEMMRTTAQEVDQVCRREKLKRPIILAVTVLTSLGPEDLRRVGFRSGIESQVARLARLATDSGMDGVVASPLEVKRIRRECGIKPLLVTPGVRPRAEAWDDQKRVMTPLEAIKAGSDFLVIGRPIRDAKDPVAMARDIVADIEKGLAERRRK